MIKIVIALIVAIATAVAGFFGVSRYEQAQNGQPDPAQQVEMRAVAGEAVTPEPYDPNIPMHLRDGGESDTKPVEQVAYYPLYAPDAVRWGRNMYGLAQAAAEGGDASDLARLGYCEYQLRPNGTFRYYGVIYAEDVVSEGDYQLRNGMISLTHRRVLEARSPRQMLSYLTYGSYRLGANSTTGRREFSIEIHNYLEDFYWDKSGYRDSSGQRYQAPGSGRTPASNGNWMNEECAKNLSEARQFFLKLTEEQMKGAYWQEMPNRLLSCPAHKVSYDFNPDTMTVDCRKSNQ